ncbi:hypothetical protein JB92DRAFT_10551 [Gautieria morchelliformis]|nr:hypothetical protein JB92DRAFT_10551 [Gautieria morchelliformis]
METEETDPAKLAGASPKPDEGQTVNPLEREGPGTFKDGLVNAQPTPPRHKTDGDVKKKLLGGDMTEGTDRARSAGASSKPDEGKALDPVEKRGQGKFKDGLVNAQPAPTRHKTDGDVKKKLLGGDMTEGTDRARSAGASSKPDEGKALDPVEKRGQGKFKDGPVNAQPAPPRHKTDGDVKKKLLGADMTEGTDRARSAGASSQPDEGKGLDPLEREGEGKFKGGLLNAQHVEVASKAEATRHSPRGAGSLSALVEHPWEANQTAVVEPLGASNDVATAVSGQLDAPLTAQDKGDAMDVDFDVAALCALFEKLSLHDQTAVAEPLVVGNDVTTAVSGELHAPPTEQGEEGGPMDVDWEGSSHSSLSSADEDDDEDDADRMEVDDEDVPMTDMTPESQPNHTVSCYGPCNGITVFQAYC